jgi:hypothetical protein
MFKPRFQTFVELKQQPRSDQEFLALLRQATEEVRAASAGSRTAIRWSGEAIALLDRLHRRRKFD